MTGRGYGRDRRDDRRDDRRGDRRDDRGYNARDQYGGRRDTGRDFGRDRRERSPDRGPTAYGREERRQDINQRYGDRGQSQRGGRGPPGGYAEQSSSSGLHSSSDPMELASSLPSLPSVVEIPKGKGHKFEGTPLKKARGSLGKPIMVLVNHFPIQSLPIVKVYQYEIRMRVPQSSQRRGSEKVSAMQQAKVMLQTKHLWGSYFVFDNVSFGWSTEELFPEGEERQSVVDLPGHTSAKPNQVEVAIRRHGKLNIAQAVDYLQAGGAGLNSGVAGVDDVFKALNALFREDPAQRFITFPKSTAYFARTQGLCQPLGSTGGVLEAMRGIYQAVSFGFGKLSLNIDTKCCAFFTPGLALIDVAAAFCGTQDPHRITRGGCEEGMIGMFFRVKHLGEHKNSQKFRVQKVSEQNAITNVFRVEEPGTGQSFETNVRDYYARKYNVQLKYPELPLLLTRNGMFPMELTFSAPNERYKQPLQGPATADFIKFATSPAHVRSNHILENVKRLAHWTLAKPKEWGVTVSPRMLETPATILDAPPPIFKNGTERGVASGSWNLRGKVFLAPKAFRAWGMVYFPSPRRNVSDHDLDDFCRGLLNTLNLHGLQGPRGPPAILRGNPTGGSAETAIQDVIRKTDSIYSARPDLILFLLHQQTPPGLYKAYKQACECVFGIASQFMIAEKATSPRGQAQYFSNVAMKINAKLGGYNWEVSDPFLRQRKVMMLGADSTHPSPSELRREAPPPSYGCLVGSMDPACAFYSAVAVAQPATQELIAQETMSAMFKELLNRYVHKNGGQPNTIIFFRDGISDHQVEAFLNTEVKALKACRDELGLSFTLTVINCVKRHHTRFFPQQGGQQDRLGNVVPCTVIHNCQGNNDIYVVSQAALQGTCRPTHYISVLDENKLSIDDYSRIIIHGCFSYQRATRSVSLHSAVYYADQCCERAKLHLREENGRLVLKDVKQALSGTMYWQ